MSQSVRGRHYALVAVVDVDGRPTGEYMYVRYCSGCWRGLPLHMFRDGLAQCNRCVDGDAEYRRRAAQESLPGRPPDVNTDDLEYSTPEKALIMDYAYGPGLCKAKNCREEVARIGSGPQNTTRAAPMCGPHLRVASPHWTTTCRQACLTEMLQPQGVLVI